MRKLSLLVSVASGLSPYIATTPSGQVVATLHRNTLPREPLTLDTRDRRIASSMSSPVTIFCSTISATRWSMTAAR